MIWLALIPLAVPFVVVVWRAWRQERELEAWREAARKERWRGWVQ